jgi:hypothetical protein
MKFDEDRYHLAKQLVREAYEANLGKIILVTSATGYKDGDSIELHFAPPLRAVVQTSDLDSDIYPICGEWMDPVWIIEALDERPELTDVSSLFVYATSHNLKDGSTSDAKFTLTGETYVRPKPDFVDFTGRRQAIAKVIHEQMPTLVPTITMALHEFAKQLEADAEVFKKAKQEGFEKDYVTRAVELHMLAEEIEVWPPAEGEAT